MVFTGCKLEFNFDPKTHQFVSLTFVPSNLAYGCCHNSLDVLCIDGGFLKAAELKGNKLIIAATMNGNRRVVPFLYKICKSENTVEVSEVVEELECAIHDKLRRFQAAGHSQATQEDVADNAQACVHIHTQLYIYTHIHIHCYVGVCAHALVGSVCMIIQQKDEFAAHACTHVLLMHKFTHVC